MTRRRIAGARVMPESVSGDYRRGYWAGREVGLSETGVAGEIATLRDQVTFWKHRAEIAQSRLDVIEAEENV